MGISARLTLQIRSIPGYLHCLQDGYAPTASPASGFISQDRLVRDASSVEIKTRDVTGFNINAKISENKRNFREERIISASLIGKIS